MSTTRKLFANAAVAVGSSAALLLGMTGTANAEPAAPLPIDAMQAPGLSAVEGLSPAIQKAASDPYNAVSTLMAAAAAFTGDSAAPADSKNMASAVNQLRRATGRRARARTWRGAGRRGSPARGRRPGPCRRTGPRGSCRSRSRSGACTEAARVAPAPGT